MTKVYSRIPPPSFRKTSDLGWPKFTPEYPPISENFRFGMTKVYSGIPSPEYPPPSFRKTSDLGWPKFTQEYHPPSFRKTSDLGWPKFTPEYPPPFRKTSDLGWPKFTPEYLPSPHFRKLQIWDDQSLVQNTPPPILENFRFEMTKVYSGIPPPHFRKLQIWDDQSLLRNTPPQWKLWESPSPRASEYWELLHVETLSNPDNYSFEYSVLSLLYEVYIMDMTTARRVRGFYNTLYQIVCETPSKLRVPTTRVERH